MLWRAIWDIIPFRASHTAVGRNLTAQHVRETSLVQKTSKKQSLRTRPFWSCPKKSIKLRVNFHTDIVRELVGILSDIEKCLKASEVVRHAEFYNTQDKSISVALHCTYVASAAGYLFDFGEDSTGWWTSFEGGSGWSTWSQPDRGGLLRSGS